MILLLKYYFHHHSSEVENSKEEIETEYHKVVERLERSKRVYLGIDLQRLKCNEYTWNV